MNSNRYILMLENDQDDQYITKETLAQKGIDIPIQLIESSAEIVPYLEHCVQEGHPLPGVIIISIKSTPDDGLSVLKLVKAHRHFHYIPVIMLCERSSAQLINACYQSGANSVVEKPSTNILTVKKIELFIRYWFEVAELPAGNEWRKVNSG